MRKTHFCKKNINDDILIKELIEYDESFENWTFLYESYADEKEVEMGEAEYYGQFKFSIQFVIYFCPFCGEQLKSIN